MTETMTMIERVARAMCVAKGIDPDEPTHASGGTGIDITVYQRQWQKQVVAARAAIEAMREPSEKMAAAFFSPIADTAAASYFEDDDFEYCYRAMINAALEDTQ